jgi:hypothetical protein
VPGSFFGPRPPLSCRLPARHAATSAPISAARQRATAGPGRTLLLAVAIPLTACAGTWPRVAFAEVPGVRLARDITPLNYAPRQMIVPAREAFAGRIDNEVRITGPQGIVWRNAGGLAMNAFLATQ